MVATRKQMNLAARERRLRKEGKVKRQPPGQATRPFGSAKDETLKGYASLPDPKEQKTLAKKELRRREAGGRKKRADKKAFRSASKKTVEFYAKASLKEIDRRNKRVIDGE